MKSLKLIILILLSPLTFFGQTLNGLWIGSMSNDSTTIRKDQSLEIALAEYKGKVTGYSRATFIVNDTLYYIVKRVKGTIDGDVCEIKDDYIVSSNFPKRIDKGVKVISTFRRNKVDSTWYLEGDWKTNQTKKYYSLTGKMDLKGEKDYTKSALFPHLNELNLTKDLPYYQESPPPVLAKTSVQTQSQAGIDNQRDISAPSASNVRSNTVQVDRSIATIDPKQETAFKPEEQTGIAKEQGNTRPGASQVKTNTVQVDRSIATIDPKQETAFKPESQSGIAKPDAGVSRPDASNVKTNTVQVDRSIPTITTPENTKPVDPNAPAAYVDQRVMDAPKFVNYTSDSLVIALYDNGEIDGDTVSVFVNGELFIAKQGLKTTAVRKTIHITPGNENLTLTLYAENLGKYPPNTGLLVVYDGEERHQIHFSADLKKNAAVIFKRKR
jgi:hypothetical protein